MQQSTSQLHVAIVMDGNGRWAARQGLPRVAGHRAGARAVRRIVEAAPGLGVGTLTLYAFSSDNWRRPSAEVAALMELFARYFADEAPRCRHHGVQIEVIGRRDRLAPAVVRAIESAESLTAMGDSLTLRIGLDYSGQDAIRRAALALAARGTTECSPAEFGALVAEVDGGSAAGGPVDVFIRTGGEQRLSDFLLWELAYAELFFRPEMWPEFTPGDLAEVLADFRQRERRFGGVGKASVLSPTRPALRVVP